MGPRAVALRFFLENGGFSNGGFLILFSGFEGRGDSKIRF